MNRRKQMWIDMAVYRRGLNNRHAFVNNLSVNARSDCPTAQEIGDQMVEAGYDRGEYIIVAANGAGAYNIEIVPATPPLLARVR